MEESETITQKEDFKGPIVLIKEAWNVYRQNAITYIFLILLSIVASLAGLVILALAGVAGYALSQSWVVAALLASVIGLPVLIYLQLLLQLSLTKALMADYDGAKTSVSQAISGTRSLVIPFFLTQLLSTFIMLGGYMLFLLPGILITVWFSMFTYIFLDQGKKGMMALLTSREYVRGYFTIVFLYPIVLGIVLYVLIIVPTTILERLDLQEISSIFSLLINFVVAPLTTLYTIGIYKELKRIKGEVKVENYAARKTKYIAVGVLGTLAFLAIVGMVISFVPTFMEVLQSPGVLDNMEDFEQLEQPSEEDFYLPEAV